MRKCGHCLFRSEATTRTLDRREEAVITQAVVGTGTIRPHRETVAGGDRRHRTTTITTPVRRPRSGTARVGVGAAAGTETTTGAETRH